MNTWNKNSGYGQGLLNMVSSVLPVFGNIFVVLNSSDSDESNFEHVQRVMTNDPDGLLRFYTSIESAYAAMESNNNDVMLIDANSLHNVAAMLTLAKNRVHLFGMDGGDRLVTQGAKIEPTAAATDMAATITITGTRCSLRNLKIMNWGTHANSIASVIDEGEGTLIKNCNIAKYSDLNVAAVADFICRSDGATYDDCEFGFDTLVQSAARATFWIKNSGATRMKYARVRNCRFVCASSDSTKMHIKVENTSSLAFTNLFESCKFLNAIVGSLSAARLDDAVQSASGLAEGNLFFVNPATDTTEFCSGTADNVRVCGAVTANAATGESANAA